MTRKISKRIAIYARVSTNDQHVDTQLHDLREHIANRKWPEAKEYVDVGISGRKEKRPAWNELWDEILKSRVDVVVVAALDRLGRSLPHLVKIIEAFVSRDIVLVSFRENIDLSTSTGRMVAGIFSVMADYELSIIRERTKAGLRRAKKEGKQIGAKKTYYDKKIASELRDAGWGQQRIARELRIGVGTLRKFLETEYVPRKEK